MTKHQQAYRKALIEKGLPEVYAHMAAKNMPFYFLCPGQNLVKLLTGYFSWPFSPEGWDFWDAIVQEAHHVSAN